MLSVLPSRALLPLARISVRHNLVSLFRADHEVLFLLPVSGCVQVCIPTRIPRLLGICLRDFPSSIPRTRAWSQCFYF